MTKDELAKSIAEGVFLLVCSGESYSAQITTGTSLMARMFEAMFGDTPADWPKAECDQWRDELLDPDKWNTDYDYGPIAWESDVGETDHIQIMRITDFKTPSMMGCFTGDCPHEKQTDCMAFIQQYCGELENQIEVLNKE